MSELLLEGNIEFNTTEQEVQNNETKEKFDLTDDITLILMMLKSCGTGFVHMEFHFMIHFGI